jgi:CheY-like chemotaxis protein
MFHCRRADPPVHAMNPELTILIVEDDEGHAILIRENLEMAGLKNPIRHFRDGQAILDFFFDRTGRALRSHDGTYLVLLDIRMPKVDGIEVLRRLKSDPGLRKLPVVMLTTTDDAREVERCHVLGCNVYIQKPVDYDKFAEAIRRLGQFVDLLLVPPVGVA